MMKRPVLTIPEEAKEAMSSKAKTIPIPPPKKVHKDIVNGVHNHILWRCFGDRMKPTIKQRLIRYSSFTVLKQGMRQC